MGTGMKIVIGRFFTHAGVLAVFKPRRGCLKIPVVPTGKLKLHVFPLRRAKENKACTGNRYALMLTASEAFRSQLFCHRQNPKNSKKGISRKGDSPKSYARPLALDASKSSDRQRSSSAGGTAVHILAIQGAP